MRLFVGASVVSSAVASCDNACNRDEFLNNVINANDGVARSIGIECMRTKKKKAFWSIFCDNDENGVFSEGDEKSDVITKECNPVNNAKSLWEINCGDGNVVRQCGVDLAEAAAIRNSNAEPLPVIAECVKVMNAKKTRWRYTCDENQNGVVDSDERSFMAVVNKNKFNNVDFDCGSDDNCFNCKKKDLKSFTKVEYEDGLIIECVGTDWAKGKAKYRYGCDSNGNGVIDGNENTKEVNVQVGDDGVCTRKEFDFECKEEGSDTSEPATTIVTTYPHSTMFMGLLK